MNLSLKTKLYNLCLAYVEQRLRNIQTAIDAASESGNDETKSSAGDKHETGRAMMQLEQEKNTKQLEETLILKKQLHKINPNQQALTINPGSIVITTKGNFYISISAGKIKVDNTEYIAVSAQSPIGMRLMGLSANQELNFNGMVYKIQEVI
jgi:transcription elongation GreA/GreB family factor